MRNNIKNIKPLLRFDNEDDFYFVQLFQRRKDIPDLKHGVIRIKSYCIYTIDELEDLLPNIMEMCDEVNARAYLRLNRQNSVDVTLRCIEQLSKNLQNGNPRKGRAVWDVISGQKGKNFYWILDLDSEHFEANPNVDKELIHLLKEHFLESRKMNVKIVLNPTKSGLHLILPGFDTRVLAEFNKQFSDKGVPIIQIQKDANTLLYVR